MNAFEQFWVKTALFWAKSSGYPKIILVMIFSNDSKWSQRFCIGDRIKMNSLLASLIPSSIDNVRTIYQNKTRQYFHHPTHLSFRSMRFCFWISCPKAFSLDAWISGEQHIMGITIPLFSTHFVLNTGSFFDLPFQGKPAYHSNPSIFQRRRPSLILETVHKVPSLQSALHKCFWEAAIFAF